MIKLSTRPWSPVPRSVAQSRNHIPYGVSGRRNGGKTINRTAPESGLECIEKSKFIASDVRRGNRRASGAPGRRGTGKDPVKIQFPAAKRPDASGRRAGVVAISFPFNGTVAVPELFASSKQIPRFFPIFFFFCTVDTWKSYSATRSRAMIFFLLRNALRRAFFSSFFFVKR